MLDRCQLICFGFERLSIDVFTPQKNRTNDGPGIELAVARIKIEGLTRPERSGSRVPKS